MPEILRLPQILLFEQKWEPTTFLKVITHFGGGLKTFIFYWFWGPKVCITVTFCLMFPKKTSTEFGESQTMRYFPYDFL